MATEDELAALREPFNDLDCARDPAALIAHQEAMGTVPAGHGVKAPFRRAARHGRA